MAHNIWIKPVPHTNKDGSKSLTKKDYEVIDRWRGKQVLVGVALTKRAADEPVSERRRTVFFDHLEHHSNDDAFLKKHNALSWKEEAMEDAK